MGYDCTLHLVDEKAIREVFVPRLLERTDEATALDRALTNASQLWNDVRLALNEEDPESAASLLCQLAVTFSACSLPHRYERGLALSLWESQTEGADFPSEYMFSPELLFAEVVERYPALRGEFPPCFTGNYSTGVFVPADRVPQVLSWVEAQISTKTKGDRRRFKGLLGILRAAADRHYAYWEATDLAVPMVNQFPGDPGLMIARYLGNEPGIQNRQLDEAPLVGRFKSSGSRIHDGWLVSSDYSPFGTHFWDLNTWPPRSTTTLNEFALCLARSREGCWLLLSETDPQAKPRRFRPRLLLPSQKDPENLRPVVVDGAEPSVREAGFAGDRLLVFRDSPHRAKVRDILPGPLWLEGEEWKPIPGLPDAIARASSLPNSIEEPVVGIVKLFKGTEVVVWDGDGYELRGNRFEKTFAMQARSSHIDWTYAAAGEDGFFYLSNRRLFEVHRGAEPSAHVPQWTNVMSIGAGPEGSILLKEGENPDGDIAKLYFPSEGTYIHIEPELFDDKDYPFVHWSKPADRFIVLAGKFLAISTSTVLGLKRYRVSDGAEVDRGPTKSISTDTMLPPPTKRPWWKFWG